MVDPKQVIVTGPMPNDFANEVAKLIDAAQERGMDLDIAVCVAIGVAADYGRAEYGDAYLDALAFVIKARAGKALPRSGAVGTPPR